SGGDVQLTRPSAGSDAKPANTQSSQNQLPQFLCGYGTYRLDNAPFSTEAYSALSATNGLFTPNSRLLNPEVVLWRQEPRYRSLLLRKLAELLELPDEPEPITLGPQGIMVKGPWGRVPLNALGDGYRSTIRWLADFLGWQVLAGRFSTGDGCLIIDEIEQHLHPRWQRIVMSRLREHFPKVQLFATTHSPLVAAGAAELENTAVFHLSLVDGVGQIERIAPSELRGRADQTLTSAAFGLPTTRPPGHLDQIDRYTELGARKQRSAEEESEFEALRKALSPDAQPREESKWRQEIDAAIRAELDRRVKLPAGVPVDAEIRRQLDALLEIGS
ncbi:MAG: AAA family ATPase, partial [Planctomycetaceae bacterium]